MGSHEYSEIMPIISILMYLIRTLAKGERLLISLIVLQISDKPILTN